MKYVALHLDKGPSLRMHSAGVVWDSNELSLDNIQKTLDKSEKIILGYQHYPHEIRNRLVNAGYSIEEGVLLFLAIEYDNGQIKPAFTKTHYGKIYNLHLPKIKNYFRNIKISKIIEKP